MLASDIFQLTSLIELNLQFGYFCMHIFIWSCQKLKMLTLKNLSCVATYWLSTQIMSDHLQELANLTL
jgi:hypothetical protein